MEGLREAGEDRQDRVERAARPWVEPFARLGLLARGIVYAVVGVLAVRIGFEQFDETDHRGALRTIARQPFGKWLLAVVAAGFLGYALWRFAQAALDTEDDGHDATGLTKRAGYAAVGLLYTAFGVGCIGFIAGGSQPPGGPQEQQTWTARLLHEPYGRPLVIAIGIAVITIGAVSGYRGLTGRYRSKLKANELGPTTNRRLDEVAVIGLIGRGAAFGLVGVFLVKAAIAFDARQAAGLDGALKSLGASAWGDVVIVAVGIGLVAYGALSGLESRYRRVLGS
jgi:hypothetical protein